MNTAEAIRTDVRTSGYVKEPYCTQDDIDRGFTFVPHFFTAAEHQTKYFHVDAFGGVNLAEPL